MREPNYDRSNLELVKNTGTLALFKFKRKPMGKPFEGLISRYIGSDDDWECADRGYFEDMEATFNRMTASVFGEREGISLTSFDEAYPHERWIDDDFFDAPMGVQYGMWIERSQDVDRNAICICISKEDDEIHWSIIHAGKLSAVREGFERARAALEVKPPAPAVNPYACLPNFGRF